MSAHVCCNQTAGWITMPLGWEIRLGPGSIVLDGAPPPKKKMKHNSPHFSSHVLWSNGWIDQDATWYGGRPRPWPHSVGWSSSSRQKRHNTPPHFGPCSLGPNGCIRMAFDTDVGLGPDHVVLDGDRSSSSIFTPK